MTPPPSITSTPAIRALERAELYPLHIKARSIGLALIFRAQDNLLSYDQVQDKLSLHGYRVSDRRCFTGISISPARVGAPLLKISSIGGITPVSSRSIFIFKDLTCKQSRYSSLLNGLLLC